jgi:hypothetical protein
MLRLALTLQIVLAFALLIAGIDGKSALEQEADTAEEEFNFGESEEITDAAIAFNFCAPQLCTQVALSTSAARSFLLASQFKDEVVLPPPLD